MMIQNGVENTKFCWKCKMPIEIHTKDSGGYWNIGWKCEIDRIKEYQWRTMEHGQNLIQDANILQS